MKKRMNLFGRSVRVSTLTLISLFYLSRAVLALEPIGVIGEPIVEQHAFLSNERILRVLYNHIEIVAVDTGAVIDAFGVLNDRSDVILSPTASHLAILNYSQDSKTTTVEIWDTHARQQTSHWEMVGPIRRAALSRTRPLLAVSFDDEITLHNYQTGAFIGKLIGERRPWKNCHTYSEGGRICASRKNDHALTFTPDDRYLIVASARPDVELWNLETRRLEAHFQGHTGNWVEDAVISPDGRRLATFERHGNKVYVWDVETQQRLWQEKTGIGGVAGVAFSPNSQHLYVGMQTTVLRWTTPGPWRGWDDNVYVYAVETGKQVDLFAAGDFYQLQTILLSPDGKKMLLPYSDAVLLWDIQERRPLKVWADFVYGWNDAMSADGKAFVSVSRYYLKAWDVASQQLRLLASAENDIFEKFALSPDGEKIAIGRGSWIEVRDLRTGTIEHRFQHSYANDDIAFSATGRWVATRGYKKIHLLDLENPERGQMLASEAGRDINYTTKFSFSENDAYLAAATHTQKNNDSLNGVVLYKRIADTFIFQYAWQMPERSDASRPAFVKGLDGSLLLAVPQGHETQIFKLLPDKPELLSTLDVGAPLRWTADGRYLFANQDDGLKILDWQTQTSIAHPPIRGYLDVSRDASVLLSYADTGEILVWDVKALLPSHPVAVEPNAKQIAIFGAVKQNQLLQNFPNPFNPETWIPFRLANESHVTIHIYAANGQLVRRLSPGIMPAGDYASASNAVYWDGRNQTGEPLSSGVYLYAITAGNFSATRKMLIRK